MKTTELQAIKQRYNIVGNCEALNHVLDVALQVAQPICLYSSSERVAWVRRSSPA